VGNLPRDRWVSAQVSAHRVDRFHHLSLPSELPVIEPSADVDKRSSIGGGTRIWHLAQVREGAQVGENCVIGRGAYIGPDVVIGDNVKIQNHALIYEPSQLGDGVFIGPAVVLTNDRTPRAVDAEGVLKDPSDWDAAGVIVRTGAAIGAQSVIIAGVTVGEWALVGAGSVVTKDVEPHALVVGNPARRVAWVGKTGKRLVHDDDLSQWRCPETGELFDLT
jgi:UDP-2-acetamido-3-amino-2,3-dideoxy-glucuronate N-acetyltransferase